MLWPGFTVFDTWFNDRYLLTYLLTYLLFFKIRSIELIPPSFQMQNDAMPIWQHRLQFIPPANLTYLTYACQRHERHERRWTIVTSRELNDMKSTNAVNTEYTAADIALGKMLWCQKQHHFQIPNPHQVPRHGIRCWNERGCIGSLKRFNNTPTINSGWKTRRCWRSIDQTGGRQLSAL